MYGYQSRRKKRYGLMVLLLLVCLVVFLVIFFNIPEAKTEEVSQRESFEIPKSYLEQKNVSETLSKEPNIDEIDEQEAIALEGVPVDSENRGYIIKESNNFIAVFYKNIDGTETMLYETDISLDILLPQDQDSIRAGMNAEDEETVQTILEGFSD